MRRRLSLRQGGTAFFMAFTAMNVSNFAFHMVTSRLLGPSQYGALGALLSLMLVLQVPVAALQVAITQQVAHRRQADPLTRMSVSQLIVQMTLVATGAALVLIALSPLLAGFLHLSSRDPVYLVAADMFPLLVGLVPRAVFLGQQRFRPVSVAIVTGAVCRLVLGFVLGHLDKGVEGAVAATVLGDLVMTVLLLLPLRGDVREEDSLLEALEIRLRDASAAGVAFAGLLLLIGTDTVLARHYLSSSESGAYVAAATAGRSALFLSIAVGLIVFPRFAATNGEGAAARRALTWSLGLVLLLGMVAAALIALIPHLFVTLLLGSAYGAAAGIVGTLATGSALLGVLTLLVYFYLARRSPVAWFPWLGVVASCVAIGVFHDGRQQVAQAEVCTVALLTVVLLVYAFRATSAESEATVAARHRPPLPAADAEIDLTVVVPFYNPGPRFLPSLERLVETLRQEDGLTFEVIAVSDGSTDGSAEALEEMHSDVVQGVILPRNFGKGEALRVGFSLGRGRYVGFIDADGDIDASLFHPYLALVELYHPDIILGSKRHPMSEVVYPPLRRIYSWGYQQLMRALFRLDVRDTQTGIKLLRRDVLAQVLPRMVEQGFAFDLELFVVARHLGYRKVFEAPVRIGTRFSSSVSRHAVLAMFRDTFKIFYRLRILREYDAPNAEVVRRIESEPQ